MNGPNHYGEAERLSSDAHGLFAEGKWSEAQVVFAAAQVHATLALAAATAGNRTTWNNPADHYTATYVEGDWPEAIG